MRTVYPSDVTREQFEAIGYILTSARKVTRPRRYDLYDVFCAVQYVLREGCRWRALPHDFPPWNNVYYHYQTWSQAGPDGKSALDKALEEPVLSARVMSGRQAGPSMTIADSKSVKNAFTAGEKGYDGGKKNNRHKNTPRR